MFVLFYQCCFHIYAGDEYDFVILSLVRSQPLQDIANPDHVWADRGWVLQNLGFITDQHQINVGITRSKFGLVLVGKYDTSLHH